MAEERDLLAANSRRDIAGRSQPAEAAASTNASAPAELTVEQILAWADAHKAAHGAWPAVGPGTVSGMIVGTAGESWKAINHALVFGLRGLPGDSSLAELLAEHRGAPLPDMGPTALAEKIWAWEQEQFPVKGPRLRFKGPAAPDYRLTVEQILAWADAHHAAGGKWPTSSSGTVQGAAFEVTWSSINQALIHGRRGLAGGTTLARVLTENRGRRTVRTPLTVEQILAWADAYHASNGCWPVAQHSPDEAAPGVTWWAIAQALRHGLRGLAGGTSLARLLVEHRGPEASRQAPPLTVEQILDWADAHHATHGEWPIATRAAVVPEAPSEHWQKLDMALRQGHRGLAPGNSLARLLAEHRGVRNLGDTPRLTEAQILTWADAHHAATGKWPTRRSGPIADAPGENWLAIHSALLGGLRGLSGGMTLPRLLADRTPPPKPELTLELIRAWAEGHEKATGIWPDTGAGPVAGVPGETWCNINKCLRRGRRGLPGGMTLVQVLGRRSNPEIHRKHSKLTVTQILAWADAHHATTGKWPTQYSGPIPEAPGERWMEINSSLNNGGRGLPGHSSLKKLLQRFRGTSASGPAPENGGILPAPPADREAKTLDKIWAWEQQQFPVKKPKKARTRTSVLPAQTTEEVLAWADAHYAATGRWPSADSGRVHAAPLELNWNQVNKALYHGRRGFPGGSSLRLLLAEHRDPGRPLSVEQILAWADQFHAAHGRWPRVDEQPGAAAPGESWVMIDRALRRGKRGLRGGYSLSRLLIDHRGQDASRRPPPLTEEQILAWADAHHAATGRWPMRTDGPILEAPEENWSKIDVALHQGHRGLSAGNSLARLLARHRGVKHRLDVARLSVELILTWADAHHAATGKWPTRQSGTINAAPDETWWNLDSALHQGIRGLGVKTTLARCLAEHRGVPIAASPPGLTLKAIVTWADAHYRATGEWPGPSSGRVAASPQHTWSGIATALRSGSQGLPKGLTIASVVARRRPPDRTP